ncbi:hypothetical protein GJ496_009753 [Pomphorhynchus laevis]|nr:hypothetical protein GJ496_009753 [Pomphorhynchus laevis]
MDNQSNSIKQLDPHPFDISLEKSLSHGCLTKLFHSSQDENTRNSIKEILNKLDYLQRLPSVIGLLIVDTNTRNLIEYTTSKQFAKVSVKVLTKAVCTIDSMLGGFGNDKCEIITFETMKYRLVCDWTKNSIMTIAVLNAMEA